MKKQIIILLAPLLVIGISSAISIDIGVVESLKGEVNSLYYKKSGNLVKFSTEFIDIGSTAYKARARIDILKDNTTIFTGWSKEKVLMPGGMAKFKIFWFSKESGNFTARLRVYFGNEILVSDKMNIEIESALTNASGKSKIKDIKTYENEIRFFMENKEDTSAILIPSKYPLGWIFEQAAIEPGIEETSISYSPALWTPNNRLTVLAISEDGLTYTESSFTLEKTDTWKDIIIRLISFFLPI